MEWLVLAMAAIALVFAAAIAFVALRRRRPKPASQRRPVVARKPAAQADHSFTVSPGFMGKVAAAYLAILTAIGGAGMLGYQSVAWFDSGLWPTLSVADAARGMLSATVPVPSALEWIPMGAVLLLGALGCLAVVFRDKN